MSLSAILKERERRRKKFQKEVIREITRIARLARKRFNFDSMYIFGSILTDRFRSWSDVDLIIKGLPPEKFFKFYSFLIEKSQYKLDLKSYEELPPSIIHSLKEAKKIA